MNNVWWCTNWIAGEQCLNQTQTEAPLLYVIQALMLNVCGCILRWSLYKHLSTWDASFGKFLRKSFPRNEVTTIRWRPTYVEEQNNQSSHTARKCNVSCIPTTLSLVQADVCHFSTAHFSAKLLNQVAPPTSGGEALTEASRQSWPSWYYSEREVLLSTIVHRHVA